MARIFFSFIVAFLAVASWWPIDFVAGDKGSCQFAHLFDCKDFLQSPQRVQDYLDNVMKWEGEFAQPGVGYDPLSGHTYDGHPIDYQTGELYGEPHLFSAPSKESIHVALLALAIDGNANALRFVGGLDKALSLLQLKINGYERFNARYPGYGCFTPWVGFDSEGILPLESWSTPFYKVPGLDNGEWFWALYAVAHVLKAKYSQTHGSLAEQYAAWVDCQKANAKTIFYRGGGNVSATVNIKNAFVSPTPSNYFQGDGYLNDPYEGETLTQLLYLFSSWESDAEREELWVQKRALFQAVNYTLPKGAVGDSEKTVTVQQGYWFSSHEQWKLLLLPYLSPELPLVRKVFLNAEKVRTWDARLNDLPGLMASINDVTDGSQDIPDYASACGIASVASQEIERRDLLTPYGSYAIFLQDVPTGLCWYNNMLRGPRMQSRYGSTEAINANSTEISPLTTWDSKITTVLAMNGGLGEVSARALKADGVYKAFVEVVAREHRLLFGSLDKVLGEEVPLALPGQQLSQAALQDWDISC
eukprot:scaffold1623_cov165-Ochromonas_danica.AAC.15